MRQLPRIVIGAAMVALLACNERHPLDASLTPSELPTAVPPPPALAASTYTLSTMTLSPFAVLGGFPTRGSVLMTAPAPVGGTVVTLSTADPDITIPSMVTVPTGRDSVDFDVATRAVGSDRQATIVASVPERSTDVSLALWSVQPTFLSFTNDPPYINGWIAARRVVPPAATFTGFCVAHTIDVSINEGARDSWFLRFRGYPNRPLAVGTYNFPSPSSPDPYMSIGGAGLGCSLGYVGQFTVREAELTSTGTVRRFWASFDLRCGGATGRATRGDLRVTALSTGTIPFTVSCLVPK